MAVGAAIGAIAGLLGNALTNSESEKSGGLRNLLNNIRNSGFFSGLASVFEGKKETDLDRDSDVKQTQQRNFLIVAGLSFVGIVLAVVAIFKK